ncbi:MAG TPA: MarR family winged helix-turn-helix transcriptional regulator [Solirubrobacteraceae bacterium]|jgi:DNA-binding MarR family transcriptional regulator|nr:MarR family winged helix-turn-helix transcriptional regulator [Solirubrobacteraceae bacterium]
MYLANHSNASNRDISSAIGMSDQAQTSRMLSRMEDLGLIHNRAPYNHGAPNCWRLTADGRGLVQTLERHEEPA